MAWSIYWSIVRRRWWIIALIVLIDVVASGYLFLKAYRHVGYQACLTLYVADASSATLIAAPSSDLAAEGQLLAGETAANFFADDILDVAQSNSVQSYIARQAGSKGGVALASGNLPVSGSRTDRTVNLCVSNASPTAAVAGARALSTGMAGGRSRFIGPTMAKRTFVKQISAPTVGRASRSHLLVDFALRVILGVLVALGVAFLWDAIDPTVRDPHDVEQALGVPVLAVVE